VSVDGLSINDGKPAGIDSTGYIVDAFGTVEVPGWSVDLYRAASFEFGASRGSYAASVGEPDNIGVIGLMVFTEKCNYENKFPDISDWVYNQPRIVPLTTNPNLPYYGHPHSTLMGGYAQNTMTVSGSAAAPRTATLNASISATSVTNAATDGTNTASLGTNFGKAVNFQTQKTNFERASNRPALTEALYYSDVKGLNSIGIVVDWQKPIVAVPNPFPADPGFCNPPVHWK